MPNQRLAKARASLPEGYQFGDAKPAVESLEGATFTWHGVEYVLGPQVTFAVRGEEAREWRQRLA